MTALSAALKRQASVLAVDEERAIAALPKLVADQSLLRRGLEAARKVLGARGELTAGQSARFRKVAGLVGLAEA
jgi:hypothetical protein